MLSFLFSIYIFIIIAVLINVIFGNYIPETGIDTIIANFNVPLWEFIGETGEKLQFYTFVTTFPLLYILFYKVLKNTKIEITPIAYKLIVITQIFSTALLTIFLTITTLKQEENHYFSLSQNPIALILFSGLLFGSLCLWIKGSQATKKKIKLILLSTAVLTFFQIAIIYRTPFYDLTEACVNHFSAYYTPIYKVFSSQVIGKDFVNLYGFYPYIYEPFLKIIQPVTISKINLINVFLIMLTLFYAAVPIYFFIKNKVIGFTFFMAYVYCFYIINII